MSNPISQNTTAAPSTSDSKDISSRTATQAPTGAIEIAIPNHKCDKDVKRLAKEYPNIITTLEDHINKNIFKTI